MTRARVVEIARAELGANPPAAKYWASVLPPGTGAHSYPRHWCGAFALYCLREASLTDWNWQIGKGFLWRLLQTKDPEPGDVGYLDQPFQHHFVVTEVGERTIGSVDGNQGVPGIQERNRKRGSAIYFSIAPLLRDTEPAPAPVRPTLRLGSTGDVVRTIQTILNAHGAQLVVDGQMGPITTLAVQSLQRRAGLDASGVVDEQTWAVLEQL